MKEWIVNVFLFVKTIKDQPIIFRIGAMWHNRAGTEAEKIAFLQSQVDADFPKVRHEQLPERVMIIDAEGKQFPKLITYPSFMMLPNKTHMEIFEETVFQHFAKCPANPVMVVTPIVDGVPRVEAYRDL
jgi:hypothetical protein